MESYEICFCVDRSNPLLLRTLRLAESITLGELAELVGISFGLEHCSGVFCLDGSDYPADVTLAEVMQKHTEGYLLLSDDDNSRLSLSFTVMEKSSEAVPLPCVTEYMGFNLPKDQSDIAVINSIIGTLQHKDSTAVGCFVYSKSSLTYSEKKTENAIRKRFAPETAEKEICHTLSVPLIVLLNRQRVVDLKKIAASLRIYNSGAKKKADVIADIERYMTPQRMELLFRELPITEYQRFRRYALSETQMELIDAPSELPTLVGYGLLSPAGEEVCFSGELLDYYETWFQTEKEKAYLEERALEQAMLVCCQLYGVFSLEMYASVVDRLKTAPIAEEKIKRCFYENNIDMTVCGVTCVPKPLKGNSDVKYDKKWLNAAPALTLWENSYHGENSWYIPSDEYLARILEKQVLIDEEHLLPLYEMIKECGSYIHSMEEAKKACTKLLRFLQLGESRKKVMEKSTEVVYSWSISEEEKIEKFFENWLDANEALIPRVSWGGYSDQRCPQWLKASAEVQKAESEEKRREERKRKAQEARAAKKKGGWR